MHRIPVESSDIISIGYDAGNHVLEIEFHGGRMYQYRNVDADIYDQLMRADSHGQYFNTFIHGRYRYDKFGPKENKTHDAVAFVTGNARKFRDLQLVFEAHGLVVEQLALPVDEIQSADAQEVAVKKAKQAYKLADRPVIVHDAFWSILALRGFPGAYMAEVTKWFRPDDFLRLMEGKADRLITCTDTLVYYDGKRSKVCSRDYNGRIATEATVKGSYAIEQIVIMDGMNKTIAEVEEEHGASSINLSDSVYQDMAKWFKMQRRLGKA